MPRWYFRRGIVSYSVRRMSETENRVHAGHARVLDKRMKRPSLERRIEDDVVYLLVCGIFDPGLHGPVAVGLLDAYGGVDPEQVALQCLRIQVLASEVLGAITVVRTRNEVYVAGYRLCPSDCSGREEVRYEIGGLAAKILNVRPGIRLSLSGRSTRETRVFDVLPNQSAGELQVIRRAPNVIYLNSLAVDLGSVTNSECQAVERVGLEVLQGLRKNRYVQDAATIGKTRLDTQFQGINGFGLENTVGWIWRRVTRNTGASITAEVYAAGLETRRIAQVAGRVVIERVGNIERTRHIIIGK